MEYPIHISNKVKNDNITVYFLIIIGYLMLSIIHTNRLVAANANTTGFLDFNLYPYLSDVNTDNFFTLNIAATFNSRLSYFSLLNFSDKNGDFEVNTYYTEQNIRWKISDNSPLDLTAQFNFRTGENNNRHRLGIRWRLNNTSAFENFFKSINLSYAINLHAVQFDHEDADVWQLEHAFMMKFPDISSNLYLAGFIDHTFNQNLPDNFPDNPIVAEAQLGYELFDNFYFIMEYRLNKYRRSDINNFAAGFQYKTFW